jgi:hypothetical protein
MSDDFKKLDDWMMDAAKREREQRVPEKDLQAFHDGVMKKILERGNRGFGMPYAGFAAAAALTFAMVLGTVIYIQNVRVPVSEESAKLSQNGTRAQARVEKEPMLAAVKTPAAVFYREPVSQPQASPAPKALAVQPPPLTESDIVDEVEALKELGVWTEDDEAEAGIPVEVTFGDLEAAFEGAQPSIPQGPPVAS